MRNIILYIATSVDGFIAKPNGSVDWLESIPNPNKVDYGYHKLYDSIDTTIQGYSTYKQIIDWNIEFPYNGKTNYVLTRKQDIDNTNYVKFVRNNHVEFISELKIQNGKDIWLIGGGSVNTLLFNADLIDEIHQYIMPITLGNGINIFESSENYKLIEIVSTQTFSSGVINVNYKISTNNN